MIGSFAFGILGLAVLIGGIGGSLATMMTATIAGVLTGSA